MEFLPLLFFFLIIIPSAILHEYGHGWMADRLGDPTARYAGRLTLDPRAHIDKWGTLLMPLILFLITQGNFLFAYAKPVPFNPYNLRDQRWGPVWVALAGPMSNFLLALVFGLMVRFLPVSNLTSFLSIIVYANVLLGVFNLVPIPPLDGSKLLYALLPDSLSHVKESLERYGFVVLLVFIFFFFQLISPIIIFLYKLFTGGVGYF
ncbi:MAG: site-2 protease family protein [Candidatus Magasanikbacteria bacterium]|nr:site-2 protease family protein [Candidatus Magasanikbacteria bacterium]